MKRRISPLRILASTVICIFALMVGLFVLAVLGQWSFEALWAMATGWFTYSARVIPQINYNLEMILCGLSAFGLALYFSHRLLQWLSGHLSPLPSPWPFRFTAFLSFLLLSMFGTSIAMTGIVHQSAWLVRSGSIVRWRGISITHSQQADARQLVSDLVLMATDDPDHRFPAGLHELDRLYEKESASSPAPILCSFDEGGDAPWLYPAASKQIGGRFPVIVSPRPTRRGTIVVAYSDLSTETFQFEDLPPEVAIYFE